MTTIAIIGASTGWTPKLVTDLIAAFDAPLEIRLVDINPANADLCVEWGKAANKHWNRQDKYIPYSDRRRALEGVDAVIITISTGGLDAMEHDLAIPEKYGIYATVGDTTGPGGWSRAIRNIPVFRRFAEDFAEICPRAFIVNYTNPMAALTATLQHVCPNPVVGLCHAFFSMKDVIQEIFGLEDWSKIAISIAGMNHFIWVVDFAIGGQDGYALLRERVGNGSLADVVPEGSKDEIGIFSRHKFCVELYDAFGFLPYPHDRHTSEFVSRVLCGTREILSENFIRYCNVQRSFVSERREGMVIRDNKIREWINGDVEMPKPSRETGAKMIHAYLHNEPMVDAANCVNEGHVPGLPLGACVETLAVIDGLGVRPLLVENVPEHLSEVMRPQAMCQKWITEGALADDRRLLLQALYNDPQCCHLKYHQIREMAEELFDANREFLQR